jgi:Family of unknown function (DUF6662)
MTWTSIRNRLSPFVLSPTALATWGAALLLAFPVPASADESPFASIYTAEVLPQGAMEFEQWLTWRRGKPDEIFDEVTGRSEFEYGFSSRFLAAIYANYVHTSSEPDGPRAPDGYLDTTRFTGFSAEFIYQLLNPLTDPFGFALYLEPSAGAGERAIESKLLFQKNFLDDQLIFAGNINFEWVWVHDVAGQVWDAETGLEFYIGGSYRVAPGWFVGAEFLNENGYSGHIFSGAKAQTNAFYFGPVVHYASERWWATLALNMQLPIAGNPANAPGAIADGFLVEEERIRVRFRLGIPL